jgi:hypothetical protein
VAGCAGGGLVTGLAPGLRVTVHYHLRRHDFSVADPAARRVIANVDDVTLTGVQFRVQPAGLARIRANRCREVCAYAVGTLTAARSDPDVTGWRRVTFNPYRAGTFTCDGEPILAAAEVVFTSHTGWIR